MASNGIVKKLKMWAILMKPAKRISAAVLAVATLTTFASADWKFAGYDTTNPPAYGKIYNEVIGGNYTSRQERAELTLVSYSNFPRNGSKFLENTAVFPA